MEIPNLLWHQSMLQLSVLCLMIRMISTMISTIVCNKWNLISIHLVVGDFNARVGLDSHSIHPEVIGHHCFYDTTNNNGERLVDLCEEFQLRPAQIRRFPRPRHRLWTCMNPSGSTHQLDHILINNKWKISLRNCRAYNSVELDSYHHIVSIRLVCSLRKLPEKNLAKDQSLTGRNFKMLLQRNSFNLNCPTDSMSSSAITCQHP